MSHRFADSCQQTFVTFTVYNCPKHVEFYSKNKFEKLVHLVGFIIRMHLLICYVIQISGAPGGLGCSTPPRNSEGPPKSCQTEPDL